MTGPPAGVWSRGPAEGSADRPLSEGRILVQQLDFSGQSVQSMLFLRPPTQTADIRAFARTFSEGIRVEYKSTFDENVRKNTAKMISSFANSQGGVAIIGIRTENGVAQEPIEGFQVTDEELPLVIEQKCLQGINPPVLPKITVIDGDSPGRCFLVIEIDPSSEAPHAIENSKKVFVRTGNAANPYDLADVDTIIERFTRRDESQKRRQELIERQIRRSNHHISQPVSSPKISVSVSPKFPTQPLAPRQDIWAFASRETYRGGRFIPGTAIRRSNDGVCGSTQNQRLFLDLGHYGNVFWKVVLEPAALTAATPDLKYLRFINVLESVLKTLVCSSRLYRALGYRGQVEIEIWMEECLGQSMPFLPNWDWRFDRASFLCIEQRVDAKLQVASEQLNSEDGMIVAVHDALAQLCWSFWQPEVPFLDEEFANHVNVNLHNMGLS